MSEKVNQGVPFQIFVIEGQSGVVQAIKPSQMEFFSEKRGEEAEKG